MFNWRAHIDNITLKLIRANARFYKVKDHVNAKILKANYHTLFGGVVRCNRPAPLLSAFPFLYITRILISY